MKVIRGRIVHSVVPDKIQVLNDHCIGYEEDIIAFVEPASMLDGLTEKFCFKKSDVMSLSDSQFLMPGMVDTHIHAPQYMNAGTGYDKQLLEWLKCYTYPTEELFKDLNWAKKAYPLVVKRSLRHGTTTACYFATIHLHSTQELCKIVAENGQRALIGKVCMDQEAPLTYVEDNQESIEDTRRLIHFVASMKNPLIQPIITPRFAPSCSMPLLTSLGALANEHDLHIQSHICEQKPEVVYTLQLFPGHTCSASIFEHARLLTEKTVMAHCIYLEDEEIQLFKERGVGIAHCPHSNINISSGILDVRKLLDLQMKIGLGTDVSGGHSPSILDAMRAAMASSRALSFTHPEPTYSSITYHEAFYLGTLGGAKALSMEEKIGNFKVGKQFDALVVDTCAPHNSYPVFDVFPERESFDDVLMKFIYLGDDRNIHRVFVAGKELSLT